MDNKLSKACFHLFLVIAIFSSSTVRWIWILSSIISINYSTYNAVTLNNVDDEARIAWLMSFPNSGTSYTKHLVDVVSGYNTASNYDDDSSPGAKTPIWDELSNGPFYSASSNQNWTITPNPTGFVLTKTHCGSYCLWCKSNEYISTAAQFNRNCGRTSHVPQGDNKSQIGYYNTTLAKRAVHIIRDPLSNIVARFHHHIKSLAQQNVTHFTSGPGDCRNGEYQCDNIVMCFLLYLLF